MGPHDSWRRRSGFTLGRVMPVSGPRRTMIVIGANGLLATAAGDTLASRRSRSMANSFFSGIELAHGRKPAG
jgi:hypothetical protein